MSRHLAALVRTPGGARLAIATWRGGRLTDAVVTDVPSDTFSIPDVVKSGRMPVAVVLPASEAGRRILSLPPGAKRDVADAVALETRGALPLDPGPLHVAWERIVTGTTDTQRVAAVFTRTSTLDGITEAVARAGAQVHRVDAAPMPVWALLQDRRGVAIAVGDPGGAWVTSVDEADAPRLARPLHAPADDAEAIALEIASTLATWRTRPERIYVAGPRARDWCAAIARICDTHCEPLVLPDTVDPTLIDDPLAAGALLALARRDVLPLALVAPAVVPPARRRRLVRLAVAATLLLASYGTLMRLELVRHARALEAGITRVTNDAGPEAVATLERLVTADHVDRSIPDPALARLHDIVSRLPNTPLDLQRLHFDADQVTLAGFVATFDAVEAIRRALAASPKLTALRIAEMRARLDADGVEFRLEGRWRHAGEVPS